MNLPIDMEPDEPTQAEAPSERAVASLVVGALENEAALSAGMREGNKHSVKSFVALKIIAAFVQEARAALATQQAVQGEDDSEGSWKALPDRLRGRGDWLRTRGRVKDAELMFDAATEIEGARAVLATHPEQAADWEDAERWREVATRFASSKSSASRRILDGLGLHEADECAPLADIIDAALARGGKV